MNSTRGANAKSDACGAVATRRRHAYYHEKILALARFLIPEDVTLLEVGCGHGDLLAGVPAREKCGVDQSVGYVEEARHRHPGIHFAAGMSNSFPFLNGSSTS